MSLDIEAALEALRTGEESVRRETVELLAASGSESAIKPLLVAVGDESWPVRQASAERLASFDPALLLPVLESALRDEEDAAVRNAAMENISEIARDNLSTVEEMSKATVNLAQQAENLAKLMAVFRAK